MTVLGGAIGGDPWTFPTDLPTSSITKTENDVDVSKPTNFGQKRTATGKLNPENSDVFGGHRGSVTSRKDSKGIYGGQISISRLKGPDAAGPLIRGALAPKVKRESIMPKTEWKGLSKPETAKKRPASPEFIDLTSDNDEPYMNSYKSKRPRLSDQYPCAGLVRNSVDRFSSPVVSSDDEKYGPPMPNKFSPEANKVDLRRGSKRRADCVLDDDGDSIVRDRKKHKSNTPQSQYSKTASNGTSEWFARHKRQREDTSGLCQAETENKFTSQATIKKTSPFSTTSGLEKISMTSRADRKNNPVPSSRTAVKSRVPSTQNPASASAVRHSSPLSAHTLSTPQAASTVQSHSSSLFGDTIRPKPESAQERSSPSAVQPSPHAVSKSMSGPTTRPKSEISVGHSSLLGVRTTSKTNFRSVSGSTDIKPTSSDQTKKHFNSKLPGSTSSLKPITVSNSQALPATPTPQSFKPRYPFLTDDSDEEPETAASTASVAKQASAQHVAAPARYSEEEKRYIHEESERLRDEKRKKARGALEARDETKGCGITTMAAPVQGRNGAMLEKAAENPPLFVPASEKVVDHAKQVGQSTSTTSDSRAPDHNLRSQPGHVKAPAWPKAAVVEVLSNLGSQSRLPANTQTPTRSEKEPEKATRMPNMHGGTSALSNARNLKPVRAQPSALKSFLGLVDDAGSEGHVQKDALDDESDEARDKTSKREDLQSKFLTDSKSNTTALATGLTPAWNGIIQASTKRPISSGSYISGDVQKLNAVLNRSNEAHWQSNHETLAKRRAEERIQAIHEANSGQQQDDSQAGTEATQPTPSNEKSGQLDAEFEKWQRQEAARREISIANMKQRDALSEEQAKQQKLKKEQKEQELFDAIKRQREAQRVQQRNLSLEMTAEQRSRMNANSALERLKHTKPPSEPPQSSKESTSNGGLERPASGADVRSPPARPKSPTLCTPRPQSDRDQERRIQLKNERNKRQREANEREEQESEAEPSPVPVPRPMPNAPMPVDGLARKQRPQFDDGEGEITGPSIPAFQPLSNVPVSLNSPAGLKRVSQAGALPRQDTIVNDGGFESVKLNKKKNHGRSLGCILEEDIFLVKWRREKHPWPDIVSLFNQRFPKSLRRAQNTLQNRYKQVKEALDDAQVSQTLQHAVVVGKPEAMSEINSLVHGTDHIPHHDPRGRDDKGHFTSHSIQAKAGPGSYQYPLTPSSSFGSNTLSGTISRNSPDLTLSDDPAIRPKTGGKTMTPEMMYYYLEQIKEASDERFEEKAARRQREPSPFTERDGVHFAFQVSRRVLSKEEIEEGEDIECKNWILCGKSFSKKSKANGAALGYLSRLKGDPLDVVGDSAGRTISMMPDEEDLYAYELKWSDGGTVQTKVEQILRTLDDNITPESKEGWAERTGFAVKKKTVTVTKPADPLFEVPEKMTIVDLVDDQVFTALELANDHAIDWYVDLTFAPRSRNLDTRMLEIQEVTEALRRRYDEDYSEGFCEEAACEETGTETTVWVERIKLVGPRNIY